MIQRGVAVTVVLVLTGCTQVTEFHSQDADLDQEPRSNAASEADAPFPARMRVAGTRRVGLPAWDAHVNEGAGGGSIPPPTTTSVATDKTSYAFGEPIKITFADFPGNAFDWVSFAPESSPAETIAWWSYTHGAHDGTIQTHPVDVLPTGTFVARGYLDDGWTIVTESAPFTIGAMPSLSVTVATDKTSYGGLETVFVTFDGLPGNDTDWLGTYPPYASMMSYGPWRYAGGLTSGTLSLPALYAGPQEVRAFAANRFELKGRSATITIEPQVTTDRTTYGVGQPVLVTFGGMAGPWLENFVAIATADSAPQAYIAAAPTGTSPRGTKTFDVSALADGSYVARAYFPTSPTAGATSVPFTIAR